jgi:hypothetical protein
MPRIQDIGAFNTVREAGMAKLVPAAPRLTVGMGTCGRGNGAEGLYQAFAEAIERSGADVLLAPVGMFRRVLPGAAGQRASAGEAAGHSAQSTGQ